MNSEKLGDAIKSIGKKSFVEDYDIYSNQHIPLSKKIEVLSKKYSKNGATIRVSFANEIIKNHKQKDALELIIHSPRMSDDVKEQAKKVLIDLA